MKISICSLSVVTLVLALCACSTLSGGEGSARDKRISHANLQLGIAYMRQGDLDTAMNKLKKALAADPDSASANGVIAVLYDRIGEEKKAKEHFERSLSLSPDDSQTHNNYGEFLCRQGEYTKALAQFDAAASDPLYPGIAAALTNAGICAGRIPDPKRAEEYFRKALKQDPHFAYALLQMANLRYTNGKYLDARGYIQRFEGVSKPTAESLWLGVRIEDKLGDTSGSASYALRLRNNFPDSDEAKSLREWESEHGTGQ